MRIAVIILCLLLPIHLWLSGTVPAAKEKYDAGFERGIALSGKLLRITSLDFKGLAADSVLLKAIQYMGRLIEEKQNPTQQDWDWFNTTIEASAELDKFFTDTYYFGAMMLAWSAERPQEAIELLKKGISARPDDYRLLFNTGFVYYYFLHNNEKAAEFISKAAKIKDAPPYYATLAARLAFDSGNHETAAAFLLEMIANTENDSQRKIYEQRFKAIEGAIIIETASKRFLELRGYLPNELNELVAEGILKALPEDPYGGIYYIKENGRVYSTSGFKETENK